MTNSLVDEFLSLKCAPDVLGACGTIQNPSKEISEAMGIVKRMKKELLFRKEEKEIAVYDLCAGNALGSVLLAYIFKNVYVQATDSKERKRNWELVKRFNYFVRDIHDLNSGEFLDESIIMAIHPCQKLAERVIELYNESKASSLYLLPCCEGETQNFPGRALISNFPNGKYIAWCMQLTKQCKGQVDLKFVSRCLSPKNILIEAHKEICKD